MKIYDVLIVGGGPSGITAGIYCKRAGKDVAIIERLGIGGQLNFISKISNYTGFSEIDGYMLAEKFKEHLKKFDVPVIHDEVINYELGGKIKTLTCKKQQLKAKTIILALGGNPRELKIDGEQKFRGKGVSYCVSCDGNFYKERVVAVIGSNERALQGARELLDICKKVYLLARFDISSLQIDDLKNRKNLEIIRDVEIEKFDGKDMLEKVIYLQNGKKKSLDIDGAFIVNGTKPNTEALSEKIQLSDEGFIVCDSLLRTTAKGVYACGDVRQGKVKQVSTAVGDGAISAIEACNYLIHEGEGNC